MKLKKFSLAKHYDIVCDWLAHRGCYVPSPKEMPKIGYIAYEGVHPIAAGFLRKVEGGFGHLDGLVTNPKAAAFLRDVAIDIVVKQLLTRGAELKMTSVIAYSVDNNTIMRSARHGFVKFPHTLIVANLRDH